MSWKKIIKSGFRYGDVYMPPSEDELGEEKPKITSFEKKLRSQSIPIEELDDNRIRCAICKGSPDYKTPVQTAGKDTYLCEKCLDKALDKHMKDKDKAER